jgi:hypothetical protein
MRPEAGFRAHDAGLPDELMSFVASELNRRPDMILRAFAHQAPTDGRQGRWAEHRCNKVHKSRPASTQLPTQPNNPLEAEIHEPGQ